MTTNFFNPFSFRLGKSPKDSVNTTKAVLNYRGITVMKRFSRHYVYLEQGVCVAERCGASKEAIDMMLDKDTARPWDYDRHLEALNTGLAQTQTA